ncbi:MAG TPA: MbcA/ParS/Xre antitoxin family protein [Candidatus Dormibacteraeota bacterium]|nr:MbcA/ParS/Xre antitoxin family protein [Candidatus Dormibacteraeota bacterium]
MATAPLAVEERAVALKAFQRICGQWGLDDDRQAVLLAVHPRSIKRWKEHPENATLHRDQVERISYVLGIYNGLHAILDESPFADEWIHRENRDFGGRTPLQRMLAGNVGDLAFVRHYVDAWRAGW